MKPDELCAHVARRLGREARGEPEALSGGLMNQVWRVPVEGGSVVAKVVGDHVAAAPEIPVDPSRARFEAGALEALGGPLAPLLPEGLRVPRLLDLDLSTGVLLLEDLGRGTDLGAALRQGAATPELGDTLGTFLGRLHHQTLGDATLAREHDNAPVQETREAVQYQGVEAWLREAGVPEADRVGARARDLGERLRGPGRCLVMGDLWPPSLLRVPGGWALIDWEFSHFGQPSQDVGHLLAHLWMHEHRAEGREPERAAVARRLAERFRGAYLLENPLAPGDLRDAAAHEGCEILARTLGPFRGGYLYEDADDRALREAVDHAVRRVLGASDPG